MKLNRSMTHFRRAHIFSRRCDWNFQFRSVEKGLELLFQPILTEVQPL